MSMHKTMMLATVMTALTGCVGVPASLKGTYSTATPASASLEGHAADLAQVRWGGQILKIDASPQQTCFYVIQRPLDEQARPSGSSSGGESQGLFLTCRQGFYDPRVFAPGRDITVTGMVRGAIPAKINDQDVSFARVDANMLYLWPDSGRHYGYSWLAGAYRDSWSRGSWPPPDDIGDRHWIATYPHAVVQAPN